MSSNLWRTFRAPDTAAAGMSAARAGRLWLATSRLLLLGLSLLFLLFSFAGVTVGVTVQAGVYLFGMVALNLPHGGFEHWLNLQARRTRFTLGYLTAFLLLIVLFALFFLRFPVAGLALALAVAMAKGGGADVKAMEACTGDAHLGGRGSRLLAAGARGVPIMLLPLLFFPADFRFYSGLMVDLFAPGALGPLDETLLAARPWLGGLAFALIVAHLGRGAIRAHGGSRRVREAWKRDALDTGLLVLFFTTVPVVLAVGLYFPLWYSARQIARTLASAPPEPCRKEKGTPRLAPSPSPATGPAEMDLPPDAKRPEAAAGTDMPTAVSILPREMGTERCAELGKPTPEEGGARVGDGEAIHGDEPTVFRSVFPAQNEEDAGTDMPNSSVAVGSAGASEEEGVSSRGKSAGKDPGKVALYAWGAMVVGAGATLALAVALWMVVPHLPTGLPWLMVGVAFWTVFISIIALPHVVIGEWLDREGGIWSSTMGQLPDAAGRCRSLSRSD